MKIGVLALQGSFKEHIDMLQSIKVKTVPVKLPEDLKKIKGLIIPGGESTTIAKLMIKNGLDKAIKKAFSSGLFIYGTCAGAIVLAKEVEGNNQPSLKLMDIMIKRNDYGRQIDSFEAELEVSDFKRPFRGIFIRAPAVYHVGENLEVLSKFDGKPVLIKEGRLLVSTFHPELTADSRIHEYFLSIVKEENHL